MEQMSCLDQLILSEIEKFLLVYIKSVEGINANNLYSRLHFPNSYVMKVLELLRKKKLIFYEKNTNHVILSDLGNNVNLENDAIIAAFTGNEQIVISCSKQFYHRTMKVLDHLYQNGMDLFILNYNMEALDNIHEIFSILKKDIIGNFDRIFLDLDQEFIDFFEKTRNYFNEDNGNRAIDYLLNIIYKVINKLHELIDALAHGENQIPKFKEFYELQKDSIIELTTFLNRVYDENKPIYCNECELSKPLSYHVIFFNKKIGPQIFFETGNELTEEFKILIKKLMDFPNPDPFLYTLQALTTLNYQFDLESPIARGGKEYLQISLVFNKCGLDEFNFFKKILLEIVNTLQDNKNFYKIFYNDHQLSDNDEILGQEFWFGLKNEFLDKFRPLNNFIYLNKTHDL